MLSVKLQHILETLLGPAETFTFQNRTLNAVTFCSAIAASTKIVTDLKT